MEQLLEDHKFSSAYKTRGCLATCRLCSSKWRGVEHNLLCKEGLKSLLVQNSETAMAQMKNWGFSKH